MLEEFKKFAMRGKVVDLAVGVIIGAAFGAIVSSLVGDIVMPIIGAITGGLGLFKLLHGPLFQGSGRRVIRGREEARRSTRLGPVPYCRAELPHHRVGTVPRDQGDQQIESGRASGSLSRADARDRAAD